MTGSALRSAVIILVEKSLRLHRQMHLVLEGRIAVGSEQSGVVGNRFAHGLAPGGVGLGEMGQHVSMHSILQAGMTGSQRIAGMTGAEPYPLVVVADMR